MQSSASIHEFEAFNESSASNAGILPQLDGSKNHEEDALRQNVGDLPHSGSTGSAVSTLPFSTAAFRRQDAVGVVRFVGIFDSVVPEATIVHLKKSSTFQRVVFIKVSRDLCAMHIPASRSVIRFL